MAEITKKLYYRKGGVNYGISLYDTTADVGADYLSLRVDGANVYAKLGDTAHMEATDLRIRKSGTTYAVLKSNLVELPSGYIAMFENTCPEGWTRETSFDDKFPRGAYTGGGIGGAETHTHSYSTGTVNTSTYVQDNQQVDTPAYAYAQTHYHWKNISAESDDKSSLPPFLTLVYCRKD
jgi:hypothetical protein